MGNVPFVEEYVKGLTNEDLDFLHSRLHQRLGGDLGEAADFLSRSKRVEKWLSAANTSEEWFDMLDLVNQYVANERKKRTVVEAS